MKYQSVLMALMLEDICIRIGKGKENHSIVSLLQYGRREQTLLKNVFIHIRLFEVSVGIEVLR